MEGKKRALLFLDRDGVLNREIGTYIDASEKFEVLADVVPALNMALQKGYQLIMITNQGGISKGLYSRLVLETIHLRFLSQMRKQGIAFLEWFACPHHPDVEACLCRKPSALMVQKGLAMFDGDPERSWIIGDRQRDLDAGQGAGIRGILMDSNSSLIPVVEQLPNANP